jgi:hypothetical protein
MEPEGSLLYSQVPATCPYPELTPSSPHDPSNFLNIHLNIILPSTSGFPQRPLSLRFPHQHPVHPTARYLYVYYLQICNHKTLALDLGSYWLLFLWLLSVLLVFASQKFG